MHEKTKIENQKSIPMKYNANNTGVTDSFRKHWALLQTTVQGAKILKKSRIGVTKDATKTHETTQLVPATPKPPTHQSPKTKQYLVCQHANCGDATYYTNARVQNMETANKS